MGRDIEFAQRPASEGRMQQAGHDSVPFTLDTYADVLTEERETASDQVEKFLLVDTGFVDCKTGARMMSVVMNDG